MNYIFSGVIILSIFVSFITGTAEETIEAGIMASKNSIELVLSFAGIMCMWSGFLKVSEKGGASKYLSKLLSPVINFLFPRLKNEKIAKEYISANISANVLGVGNAATPAGIKAMEELDKINKTPEIASDEMCVFTVINTASVQLIPTTVIALRASFGSVNPQGIIVPVWISSCVALICAVGMMKIILKIKSKRCL